MDKSPLVTVSVPVYNTAPYLKECHFKSTYFLTIILIHADYRKLEKQHNYDFHPNPSPKYTQC